MELYQIYMHEKCANILLLYTSFPHLFALARVCESTRMNAWIHCAHSRTTLQTTLLHTIIALTQYLLFIIFLFSYVAELRLTLLLALLHQSSAVSWLLKLYVVKWYKERRSAVEVLDGCSEWMLMARAQRGRLGTYIAIIHKFALLLLLCCVVFLYSKLYIHI